MQPLGTTCQLQQSSFKFEISSNPLAEPHCPCPSRENPWHRHSSETNFKEKFPFHLNKHIHPYYTSPSTWRRMVIRDLPALLLSPRGRQAPLPTPATLQAQDKPKSSHHSENTILLRKEKISLLNWKTSVLFQIFSKSQQFNRTKTWATQMAWENSYMALPT